MNHLTTATADLGAQTMTQGTGQGLHLDYRILLQLGYIEFLINRTCTLWTDKAKTLIVTFEEYISALTSISSQS